MHALENLECNRMPRVEKSQLPSLMHDSKLLSMSHMAYGRGSNTLHFSPLLLTRDHVPLIKSAATAFHETANKRIDVVVERYR